MKSTARLLVGGLLLLGTAATLGLWRNTTRSDSVALQFLGYRPGTNGTMLAAFVVTNRSVTLRPSLIAVQRPEGITPYHVLDYQEQGKGVPAAAPTGYAVTFDVPPLTGWEFELGLGTAGSPQRLRLFYTVGEERLGPVGENLRSLWRMIGLQQQMRELRIDLPPLDEVVEPERLRDPVPPRKMPSA